MSTTTSSGSSFAIEKAVVFIVAAAATAFGLIHITGVILARLAGDSAPAFAPGRALGAIRLEPYAPHVSPIAHLVLMVAVLIGCLEVARRLVRGRAGRKASVRHRANAFAARPGWATPAGVRTAAGANQLNVQADALRPSITDPRPQDLGYLLGTSKGQQVWASVERSVLVIGPPGSGKGLHIAINAILDAPGPVITTSTKPDNLKATLTSRATKGPVGVFDPQGMLGATFAHHVAWDAVAGCEDPMRAATRADALASNTGIGEGSENLIWRGHAKTVLETVLHAAALGGAKIETAYRWLQSEHSLEVPLEILQSHPDACPTWDARLRGISKNPDPRFVGSVMSVVASAIAPLALPTVRASLTPSRDRPGVTGEQLLTECGTLYAIATDRGAAAASGLVSALIEDIAYVARITAARSAGGRMDPPVLFLLDECANVAPIPSLPALLADGRGQNLTVVPIFQALAQVRSRYGDEDASTVFSASQIKLILGGTDDADDLRDLCELIGERDDWFTTTSRSANALAIDSGATTSSSLRKVPILPPDAIRSIPFGSAVMLLSQADPFPLRMRRWTQRPDGSLIARQQADLEAELLRSASEQAQ
ncbi:MAG: TraM recognition domain-containing protein [Actinomycetota bacterium]|nr:TraM recognition domain-containing protein [Actinomycetota bacterium]